MIKKSSIVVVVLVGLAVAWIFYGENKKHFDTIDAKPVVKESAYDRVMRTQTIRCGYVLRTPLLVKDPNTAQLSGLFYEYVENLGKALHLKIEWSEEMG